MPTLWIMEFSPPSAAVRTLAEILDVQLDIIILNFAKQEHKAPEFLKINPIGAVPLLKDGDFFLSDSHAILKYILDKYGSAELKESLYPSDLEKRALVDQAMFFDTGSYFLKFLNTYLALKTPANAQTGPAPIWVTDTKGLTAKQKADIETGYRVIETYLGDKQYVVSDHLTLGDISLGVTTASLQTMHKLDKDRFPRTTAWLARLNQLPVFDQNTRPVFERLAKSLQI